MRRICIYCIYDKDGIIDDYILYILSMLDDLVEKLVVVINGNITVHSKKKLHNIVEHIFVRDNIGFDSGAYKYAFNRLGSEEMTQYDELILCNDTFYGPFISMQEIFSVMDKKDADFWGLAYHINGYANYLQSYFLVLKKNIISGSVFWNYFNEVISEHETDISYVYAKFETGLFRCLVNAGYIFAYYADADNLNIYVNGDIAIERYHLPILKKKVFESRYYDSENVNNALQYIHTHTCYDIDYILNNANRVYGFSGIHHGIRNTYLVKKEEVKFSQSSITEADIIKFIKSHDNIYIYGAGIVAKRLWYSYKQYFVNCKGFVISNSQEKKELYIGGLPIFYWKELSNMQHNAVLVALIDFEIDEIMRNITTCESSLYLF